MAPFVAGGAARRRARRRRVGVSVAIVVAVCAALLGPASPAEAKKVYPSQSDIAAAQSKAAKTRAAVTKLTDAITAADNALQTLQTRAEVASEAYNEAQVRLSQAQAASVSAQRSAASAQRDLQTARNELGTFASDSYRSGGDLADIGALLNSDGPRTLLDRANTISVLATQRDYVLQRVESARIVADLLSQQSQSALAAVTTATAAVRTSKLQAEAAVNDQAVQLKALDQQENSLKAQLAKLDRNAVALAERRAAGLQAEAEAKAAAAARARSSSTGGGVPLNAPSGASISTAAEGRAAVAFAKTKLGTWYLWGGTGPRYDCSGLTMRAWESAGIAIPRVAADQYAAVGKISTSDLRPGDLLFFATDLNDWTTIHHVGIYVGNGQMIEAPHTGAQVRYASIWRPDLIGAGRP